MPRRDGGVVVIVQEDEMYRELNAEARLVENTLCGVKRKTTDRGSSSCLMSFT